MKINNKMRDFYVEKKVYEGKILKNRSYNNANIDHKIAKQRIKILNAYFTRFGTN